MSKLDPTIVKYIRKAVYDELFRLIKTPIGLFSDGKDKGSVTISKNGTKWTVNDGSIRNSKILRVGGEKVIQSPNYRLVTDEQIAYWNSLEDTFEKDYSKSFLLGGM